MAWQGMGNTIERADDPIERDDSPIERQTGGQISRGKTIRAKTERELTAELRKRGYWKMYEKQYGLCCLCNKALAQHPRGNHVEHKVAIVVGGKTTEENCGLAHANCNLKKGTMSVEEFKSKFHS